MEKKKNEDEGSMLFLSIINNSKNIPLSTASLIPPPSPLTPSTPPPFSPHYTTIINH